jgi:copper chaperone CopZ
MITTVTVSGMITEHCKRAVFTSLSGVAGIIRADVQLGTVTVEHDGRVTIDQLREAIAVAGYTVTHGVEDRRTLPLV